MKRRAKKDHIPLIIASSEDITFNISLNIYAKGSVCFIRMKKWSMNWGAIEHNKEARFDLQSVNSLKSFYLNEPQYKYIIKLQ